MTHNIRQRVIDPIRGQVVKTETVHGELGSKVFDKNGKEIFENDIVQNSLGWKFRVKCSRGTFVLLNDDDSELFDILHEYRDGAFEVVGHAENVD